MTEKKISRRDAIKLLGAAVGATALANLPSKWNKPELVSGVLPAHAQTSGCPAGSSSLSVFLQGPDFQGVDGPPGYTTSGTSIVTGFTYLVACRSDCFNFQIGPGGNFIDVVVTLNGVVIFNQNTNLDLVVFVNGATGEYNVGEFGVVVPPASCGAN